MNFKKYTFLTLTTLFLGLSLSTTASAFSLSEILEEQLLNLIDEEILHLADSESEYEWTEEHGVQPREGYELDYAEKCEIIKNSKNLKAISACEALLGS
jgi:hypothetical protein